MAQEIVIKCDICQKPGASTYRIQTPQGRASVDLCEEHAAPLVELYERGRRDVTTGSSGARNSRTAAVLDRKVRV